MMLTARQAMGAALIRPTCSGLDRTLYCGCPSDAVCCRRLVERELLLLSLAEQNMNVPIMHMVCVKDADLDCTHISEARHP